MMNDDAPDLLPCPFCGHQPKVYGAQIMVDGDCPEAIDCENDDCPINPTTGYMQFDQAIAAWNTRAAPSAPRVRDLQRFRLDVHEGGKADGWAVWAVADADDNGEWVRWSDVVAAPATPEPESPEFIRGWTAAMQCQASNEALASAAEAERGTLQAENARLREALGRCVQMLDDLKAESGRGIDWGYEDAFRMGEWFEADDLAAIEVARILAKLDMGDAE